MVTWIVFGLIFGSVARLLMPGKQGMSWLLTILLGVVGSFAGGAISAMLFTPSEGLIQPNGWIMSILGALVVLSIDSRIGAASARQLQFDDPFPAEDFR